jgi:hypothetical protein
MLTIAPREVRSSGYLPRPALHHLARHGLAHQERALDVDADHRVEVGLGHVQEIRSLEDAGVVDQHVDAAMRGQGARDQRVHVGLVADVAVHVDPAEFGCQRLARRVGQIGQHHVGAFAREAAGAGLADALGAAGDDDDAAVVAEVDLAGIGCGHGEVSWMK